MTSLKESIRANGSYWSGEWEIERWAKRYIKELEEHMTGPDWHGNVFWHDGYNCATQRMLRFLKGEVEGATADS